MLAKTRLITDVLKDIEEQAAAVRERLESASDDAPKAMQLTPTTSFGFKTTGGVDLLRVISLADKVPPSGGPWSPDHEHWFQLGTLKLDTALGTNDLILTLRVSCTSSGICGALQSDINAISTWTEVFQAKGLLAKSDWIHATPTPMTGSLFYYEGSSPEGTTMRLVMVVSSHMLVQVIWLAVDDSIVSYFTGKVQGDYASLTYIGNALPSAPPGGWYYYKSP